MALLQGIKVYNGCSRIVILSGKALFAEGIAAQLRQYLPLVKLDIVDSRQSDAMTHVTAAQPSVVILDFGDTEATRFVPLSQLLLAFPKLTVVCLDPQGDRVHVVTSDQVSVVRGSDLAKVIDRAI